MWDWLKRNKKLGLSIGISLALGLAGFIVTMAAPAILFGISAIPLIGAGLASFLFSLPLIVTSLVVGGIIAGLAGVISGLVGVSIKLYHHLNHSENHHISSSEDKDQLATLEDLIDDEFEFVPGNALNQDDFDKTASSSAKITLSLINTSASHQNTANIDEITQVEMTVLPSSTEPTASVADITDTSVSQEADSTTSNNKSSPTETTADTNGIQEQTAEESHREPEEAPSFALI